jgi:uncharacterized membrane protein
MGPNESKLSLVQDAQPGSLRDEMRQGWRDGQRKLQDILDELEAARAKASAAWTGEDSEAAGAAFKRKHAQLEEYRTRMEKSEAAMTEAARALQAARNTLVSGLPDPGPAPTSPGSLDAGASDAEKKTHEAAVTKYQGDSDAHQAALEERERVAGQALQDLDAGLKVAQALLTAAAPRGDQPVDSSDPLGGGSGGSGGSGAAGGGAGSPGTGANGGPVVGGSTSSGSMLVAGGSGAILTGHGGLIGGGQTKDPGTGETLPDLQPGLATGGDLNAGAIGGGGVGAATGAAGLLGAGRGVLGKLTGGGSAGAGSAGAGAPGRTAGMQKGSTLGNSRTAGAGQAQPSNAAARDGQAPAGRPAAGQGGARPAGQAGARPTAGQGGARPGAAQGGARGAGSQSGARTSANGTRPGGSGRGGPGSTGRAGQHRDEDDQTVDHLAFEDDQWIDDEETTPGVIT